jgi:hypothetical protein
MDHPGKTECELKLIDFPEKYHSPKSLILASRLAFYSAKLSFEIRGIKSSMINTS